MTSIRRLLGVPMLAAVLVFAGCGAREKSGAELVVEAKRALEQRNYKAAVIHLRTALHANPLDRDVQLLLGIAFDAAGDHASALPEVRKARQLGADPAQVVPLLARVLIESGEFKAVLDELKPEAASPPAERAAVLVARGRAHAALQQPDAARAAFDQALQAVADYPDALLGQAAVKMTEDKDMAAALALTERALAQPPGTADAWKMKGDLLRYQGRRDAEAAQAYRSALQLAPDDLHAQLSLALILGNLGQYAEGQAQVDAAKKRRGPEDPLANYMQARLAYMQRDLARAQEALNLTLKSAPGFRYALLLAGEIALEQNQPVQAESHLAAVIKAMPDETWPRLLHVDALLRLKRGKEALATLAPALQKRPNDARLLAFAGNAYLQLGDYARATESYEKAAAIVPQAGELRRSIAEAQLRAGDDARALRELESASKLGDANADALLVMTLLGKRQFDKALAAARSIAAKEPQNPLAPFLEGVAYVGKKDLANARASFGKALVMAPAYFPAARELARLDLADGNPAAARKHFDDMLAKDGANVGALLALAALDLAAGNAQDGAQRMEKARAADAKALAPRVMLARHYRETGQVEQALPVALEAARLEPQNPDAVEALGSAQLANGDAVGAVASFGRLATLLPQSGRALLLLGRAQAASGKAPQAEASYAKALALQPDSIDARAALALAQARAGRVAEAQKLVQELKQRAPGSAGDMLEGDVLMVAAKPADAVRAYQAAWGRAKNGVLAVRLYEAYTAAGRDADGDAHLRAWLKDHPGDTGARLHLADALARSNRDKDAAEAYRDVLKAAPSHAVALNNLAYVYQRGKDPRALDTAEQAYKLRPKDPVTADTYGWILTQSGKVAEGLKVLEQATASAPKHTEIRYHYAIALAKSGDKDKARGIVRQMLADGARLPVDPENAKLLQ